MSRQLGRRERKKTESRDRIVDCAASLFASRGYEVTTMEDIGECADVSRGTVFNYFPRKEDIVLAWFTDRRAEIADLLNGSEKQFDPATSLRRMFKAMAHIFERDRKTGRGMVRSWLQAGGPLLSSDSDTSRLFAATIRQGQRNGDIAGNVDADRAGRVLFDAYQGELVRWVTSEDERSDLEPRLVATLDLILTGIVAAPQRSHRRGRS